MPKLRQPPEKKADMELQSVIRGNMVRYGFSKLDELAVRTHISRATMYARMRSPENMTLRELRLLDANLHFSHDEIIKFIRGE